ncbi:MAG: fatty acid desaturase family protein [Oligoflexia bacterium]|nr:fatty acid desaturase family protein [Oligoflexia bacterium]
MDLVKKLDKKFIFEISKISNLKSAVYLLADWFFIFLIIYVAQSLNNWFLYPIAVMLIANRQHSLAIAMHDSGHGRLFTNKIINDIAGEVFCSWPMFFSMQTYRENHRQHHLYANTSKDPDFRRERFPETKKEIYKMLITDVLALNTWQQLMEVKRNLPQNQSTLVRLARILFYLSVAVAVTYFKVWPLFGLYWVVPLFTWLKVVLRLRAIADHTGVHTNQHPYDTRTIIPNLFDILFLAPRQCSYHLGHHLLQSIPSYNLKRFHYELSKISEYKANARITKGFFNLIQEFPGG